MPLTKSVRNVAILKRIFNLKTMPFCTRLGGFGGRWTMLTRIALQKASLGGFRANFSKRKSLGCWRLSCTTNFAGHRESFRAPSHYFHYQRNRCSPPRKPSDHRRPPSIPLGVISRPAPLSGRLWASFVDILESELTATAMSAFKPRFKVLFTLIFRQPPHRFPLFALLTVCQRFFD